MNAIRHFGMTGWMGDRVITKPLSTHDSTTRRNAYMHPCSSGIRTRDPSIRAVEGRKHLRLCGHRDRLIF